MIILRRTNGQIIFKCKAENFKKYVEKYKFKLQGADLRKANLMFANLMFADLRGADLGFANLKGADLVGADLGFANLKNADLSHTVLEGTKF